MFRSRQLKWRHSNKIEIDRARRKKQHSIHPGKGWWKLWRAKFQNCLWTSVLDCGKPSDTPSDECKSTMSFSSSAGYWALWKVVRPNMNDTHTNRRKQKTGWEESAITGRERVNGKETGGGGGKTQEKEWRRKVILCWGAPWNKHPLILKYVNQIIAFCERFSMRAGDINRQYRRFARLPITSNSWRGRVGGPGHTFMSDERRPTFSVIDCI